MFIVYCMVSLLSKVKKHVKFVLPTVTCDMEKQVWMIEAQKLKVISKILWPLCLYQQQPSWYLVTGRPSSINQILSINSNTQLWYHEPKPLEGWRPTRTITCEARTTFSQTLIRFKPHHTHVTHQTHVTHHTHKTYVTHITHMRHMRHITQVKSSVACEEKQREDCQTVEFEECREKPKEICKKTLVSATLLTNHETIHLRRCFKLWLVKCPDINQPTQEFDNDTDQLKILTMKVFQTLLSSLDFEFETMF